MSSTEAVILVGGKGTRLRPLTLSAPKPMLPVAGVPLLAHLISRIREAGVSRIVLGTSFQPQVFETYFGDGSAHGVELEYVVEKEPLGTGGGIRNVADRLTAETIMVFNGDVISGVDLRALLATHERSGAHVTLYLTKVNDPRSFGCVPTDMTGRVTAFLEKMDKPVTNQINAGTYVFNRSVIEGIPSGRPVSVERETFPTLLNAGAYLAGHVDTSYWRDLGRPQDFVAGSADLVLGRAPSGALLGPIGEAIVLDGAQIDPSAVLRCGATIGAGCVIGPDVVIDGSVLMDGVHVGAKAQIKESVVGYGARIGERVVLDDVVIGDAANLGADVELRTGARVWPSICVPAGGIRFSSDA